MGPLRTRFAKDIVAEFLPPSRPSDRVVVICPGFPSSPSKRSIVEAFAEKGYWAFLPRYRGTWESSGSFLRHSPHLDILDAVSQLPKGFKDSWTGKRYKVSPSFLAVVGASFGGTAALLCSLDPRVHKAVAFSPVVDWRVKSKTEPLGAVERFLREGFGEAFRFSHRDYQKLGRRGFFNPVDQGPLLRGDKLSVVHAKDDEVVPCGPTEKLIEQTGCSAKIYKRGGHLGASDILSPRFERFVMGFLRS